MQPNRRDLFRFATAGLLGSLTPWRNTGAVDQGLAGAGKAKACILVYLLGGPPHQDMWDLKPEAPAEVRGPFLPIATSVPGIRIGEHLPRLAGQMKHLALLRSVSYPNHDHPYMIYYTLTGRPSPVPLGANTVLPPSRSDHPHLGSVLAKFCRRPSRLPAYVAIPEVRVRMASMPVSGGGRAGFLGPAWDPLALNDDVRQPASTPRLPGDVSAGRFSLREGLLARIEGQKDLGAPAEYLAQRGQAVQLLESGLAGDLFSLDREPSRLRQRYGFDRFGQSLLLARRLVEAGVTMVAVHWNYMSKCDGWDTHSKNFDCLKNELLPLLDQGLSALLDDLRQRGQLDETLVVCMGEFGRTPKINVNAGRDHWGHCASVVLAGGGVQGGRVIGASDRLAAYPREQPIDPADVQATIYQALGLRAETEMRDQLGRPMPVSTGKVVAGVLG